MLDVFLAAITAFQTEVLFGGVFCAVIVAVFIISILIAIWVYRDAESRGMSGVLWLIVVLIAGIIGLIIYLVVRKDKTPMAPPSFGTPPPGGSNPGWAPPPAAQATCRNCGAPLPQGATFCEKCGTRV